MKFLLAIIFSFTWWMPFLLSYLTDDHIKTSIEHLGLLLIIINPLIIGMVAVTAYNQGRWSK